MLNRITKPPGRKTMKGFFLWQKVDLCQSDKSSFCVTGRCSVTGCSRESQVAAVIFSDDCQCWSAPWQATEERSFFSSGWVLYVCGRLPKRARKNSYLEEDGINALCPQIGQCVAELLGEGIDLREKIDLWLLLVQWSFIVCSHIY